MNLKSPSALTSRSHNYEPEADAIGMSLVPVSRRELSITQDSNNSIEYALNARISLTSRPTSLLRRMVNDISENPSRSPLSCLVPLPRTLISLTLNVRTTLILPQESVWLRYYRHERPIAMVRPVLMSPIKSADNSQGKCGRYKIKLRLFAHWSNVFIALSHALSSQVRRRIVVTPKDNSSGKSSRFKGLAIVRVQTNFSQYLEYVIACIHPLFPSSLFVSDMKLR